ncbi:MAG TPA: hypothetical protein VJP45_01860 [Candidatus Limnocylindria bacterium]|nr:hypothetical protein [Candidatus Limnocylindria bacterium]
MLTAETTRGLVFGVLLIHGLGHLGAIGALLWRASGRIAESDQAGWLAPRSWLLTNLDAPTTTWIASAFWLVAAFGFVVTALSFWFEIPGPETWRVVGVVAAVVSLTGMITFVGTWPVFNTTAAAAVNLAVLLTQLWLRWPAIGVAR